MIEDIRNHLLSKDEITNYIGGRIFIERAPQRQRTPYVLISSITRDHLYSLTNESNAVAVNVQIDVVTSDPSGYWEMDQVAEQIRLALSGKYGTIDDGTIMEATIMRDNVIAVPSIGAGSDASFKRSMDFRVWHSAAVPTH